MRRLAQAIQAYAGLDPPPWLLEARVRERADELGVSETAYLERVDKDATERSRLVERLRVGETRFFRHRAQIEALRTQVLPLLFQRGEKVRVWSAGCASGEEAYTLAALCDEAGRDWEVLGTDLSPTAIAAAETGRFASRRLEEIPEAYRRHFVASGDQLAVRPELRGRVRFFRQNLVEMHPRAVDLILCRNVLIYFDAEPRAQVVARFGDALRPGGFLCLGYSEALRAGEEARLEPVRLGESVLYRRREITARIEIPVDRQLPPAPAPPPLLPAPPPELPVLRLRGEYPDGTRLASELRPFLAAEAVVDLDGAHYLGDEAARVLQRARQAAPGLTLRASRTAILRWLGKHGLR